MDEADGATKNRIESVKIKLRECIRTIDDIIEEEKDWVRNSDKELPLFAKCLGDANEILHDLTENEIGIWGWNEED